MRRSGSRRPGVPRARFEARRVNISYVERLRLAMLGRLEAWPHCGGARPNPQGKPFLRAEPRFPGVCEICDVFSSKPFDRGIGSPYISATPTARRHGERPSGFDANSELILPSAEEGDGKVRPSRRFRSSERRNWGRMSGSGAEIPGLFGRLRRAPGSCGFGFMDFGFRGMEVPTLFDNCIGRKRDVGGGVLAGILLGLA